MSKETITLTFTNRTPTLLLLESAPSEFPTEFAPVIVGQKPDVNDIDGFTTEPLFYYILAST